MAEMDEQMEEDKPEVSEVTEAAPETDLAKILPSDGLPVTELATPASEMMETDGSTGSNKRALEPTPDAPLSGRAAKRPKQSVKFSPARGENGRVRRLVSTQASANARAQMIALGMPVAAESAPNDDRCYACGGTGHFLCCDGCPRSFHFACLNPPLPLDDLPNEAWYCRSCAAAKASPPSETPEEHKGLFGPLIARAESSNAKVFKLPETIKTYYKDVSIDDAGGYVDLATYKSNKLNRHGLPDEREPFKTRDRAGRPILCYKCGTTASHAQNRKILSCDICEQHWHLDCLSPPLAGLPPGSRRWKCPLHADQAMPRKRQPKNQITMTQKERNMPNNGLIDVLSRREKRKAVPDYDESIVNGVRYQVPEETIILDFWDKINGIRSVPPVKLSKTGRIKPIGDAASDVSSPLSSLPSTPEPDTKMPLPEVELPPPRAASEALSDDRMVLDVNGMASPLPEDGRAVSPSTMTADSRLSSPEAVHRAPLEHTSSLLPPGSDDPDSIAVNGLAPPPSSAERRERSPTPVMPTASGLTTPTSAGGTSLKVKLALPARRAPVQSREGSPAARASRSRTNSPAPVASTSAVRLTEAEPVQLSAPPAGKRANGTVAAPSSLRQSQIAEDSTPDTVEQNGTDAVMASNEKESPKETLTLPVPRQRRSGSSQTTSQPETSTVGELALHNASDLKALTHVRKMLKGEEYAGQKQSLTEFLEADSPRVPAMPFLDGSPSQPWSNPWTERPKQ